MRQWAASVSVDKTQHLTVELLVEANTKVEAESVAMAAARRMFDGGTARGAVVTSERDPQYVVRTAEVEWLQTDA